MPKTLFRSLIWTLLFALICLISTASYADETTGTIRGTVTAGGKPVSGVNMRLVAPEYKMPIDATKTDASGQYEFTDVAPGKYRITTQSAGYQDQSVSVDVAQEITNVEDFCLATPPPCEKVGMNATTISPGSVNAEATPVSSRLGRVEGYVSGVEHLSGKQTLLYLIDNRKHIYATTAPNALGQFAFPIVAPGEYRLEFRHPGYTTQKTTVSISSGQTISLTYSPLRGWGAPFDFSKPFDPYNDGYVHLRGSDENNIGDSAQFSHPDYETTAPAYGTAVLIR